MDPVLMIRIGMAVAALLCAGCIIRGLMMMQNVGSGGGEIRLQALVRQVKRVNLLDSVARVTVEAEGTVCHLECMLHGPWAGRRKVAPADLIWVIWRQGETTAVAEHCVKAGQALLIAGFAALMLLVLGFMMLM